MEYRKNYDGYWDGEKFVEQVQIYTPVKVIWILIDKM